jgi:hypothetical protein
VQSVVVTEANKVVLRRIVIAALLLTAGGLVWWSASFKAEPTSPTLTDAAVEGLAPEDGTNALHQSTVMIDLAPGWDADLIINGIEIPQDQERNVAGQDQVIFTPGEGKELERLPAGLVRVTAIIWRPIDGQSRDSGSRSVSWSFQVS